MDEIDPLLNVLGSYTAENTKRIKAVDELARLIRTQRGFKTATALDILLRILEDPTYMSSVLMHFGGGPLAPTPFNR